MSQRTLTRETLMVNTSINRDISVEDMAFLRKADDLLTRFARKREEKSRNEILRELEIQHWLKSIFAIISGSKASLANLRLVSKVFQKIVNFTLSDTPSSVCDASLGLILDNRDEFHGFLDKLSSDEVMYYGASLWLCYTKLVVNTIGTNISHVDLKKYFCPMQKWLEEFDTRALVFCLRVWSCFIDSISPKLTTGHMRKKLLTALSDPLHSQLIISKLPDSSPMVNAYMSLLSVFSNKVDDLFEEIIIGFFRFVIGKAVFVTCDFCNIENEITKPISTARLVLYGSPCEFPNYLLDEQRNRGFEESLTHVFSILRSLLGVSSKREVPECGNNPNFIRRYGVFLSQIIRIAGVGITTICLCLVELARRIEAIEDCTIRHEQSRILFLQLKACISESDCDGKELETALCNFLRPKDLTLHANTVLEWPAKSILNALLEKSSVKIGDFLDLVSDTVCSGPEKSGLLMKRMSELSCLITDNLQSFHMQSMLNAWTKLAKILTSHVKQTDEINEGTLLKPNFQTTFSFLKLLFRIGNCGTENFDMDPNRECLSVFENLYLAVQNTVKHEVECSAETLLCGVFGTAVLPETLLCVNFYLNCLAYVISIYSFGSIHEDGICSDTFGEFNALGEAATFVHIIKIINGKLKSVEQTGEQEKLSRLLLDYSISLLEMCHQLFTKINKPNLTRSMFLSLSVVLNDIHLRVFKGAFSMKEVCHNAANTFIKILEFVQKNISGPYDDELLFGCEDLLITLLSGCSRRPSKLFLATCALWMKTFAEAKTLNYSPKLKQVMLPLVNRRMIHAPDLSKNCFDEASGLHDNDASVSMSHFKSSTTACIKDSMQSPNVINMENNEMKNTSSSNECNTSQSQVGNKRKRSLRCSDPMECSKAKVARKGKSPTKFVESTAIQNSSMNEVTPRRRSTSLTKKSCLIGLLDDDSVEYVPVSTDSGKKMKLTDHQREIFSEKREWMPFLDDDSQQSAVISHLPIGFDTDSSQIPVSDITKSTTIVSTVDHAKDNTCLVNAEKEIVRAHGLDSTEEKSVVVNELKSPKKKSKVKLNFDQVSMKCDILDDSRYSDASESALSCINNCSEIEAEENKSLYEPLNDESVQKSPGCSESGLSDDLKLTRSGRTRHKKTPIKYVGAIKKSVTKNMKTVEEVLQLQSKSTYASPIPLNENESQNDPEMDKSSSLVKGDSSVTTSDLLTSNAIEDALIVEDTFNSKTEEEVDTKDSSINAVKTPERHNGISGQMSDILTAPVIQRIGTPGILKKVNSPSTAEKKLRRVHFGESIENEISVSAPTASGGVNRTIVADEQISSSPRISKQSTTKIPFVHMHRFGEQELGPSSPTSDVTMSPMKLETTSSNSIDDEPIFPRLADCEESIGRVVGKLLSISTANGALTARKSLEAKGIIQIRHLATMSRREVLMLNIKKPRIDTVIRALSQFARDYSKPGPTYSHDNTSLLDEKSTSINTVETVAPIDNTKEINPYSVEQQQSDYVSNLSVSDTEHSDQDSENSEKVEDLSDKPKVTLSDVVIEKNQRWKTVHEAFQCAASVAGDDENVDFAKLKRCALNTAKNLLDFIEWCEEANASTH